MLQGRERIEVAFTSTVQNDPLCGSILDQKGKRMKFNGDIVIICQARDRGKIFRCTRDMQKFI
jgi:hypothetical protein